MTISTIAEARDLLICRGQPLERIGKAWMLDGQEITSKEMLALAKQLDGGDRPAKYGNRKTVAGGIEFDSAAEATRYEQLRLMEQAGEIQNLELQPRYELQPCFVDGDGERHRPIVYVGDFAYVEKGRLVCEDVKGFKVDVYQLKIKLARFVYPHVSFREIEA